MSDLSPTQTERWIQEQEHELWPERSRREHDHTDCRVCGPGPLGRGEIPSELPHVFYNFKIFNTNYGVYEERVRCKPSEAKVVSSEIEGTKESHTIMLDIDLPARLVESSTPGHYHLYIDKMLRWREYKRLLRALMRAGIIEKGFYRASVGRRATHLRPPWSQKNP